MIWRAKHGLIVNAQYDRDMTQQQGNNDLERDSVFHERIKLLKDQGYRGFIVESTRAKWGGVVLMTKNASLNRTLETDGETAEEAYKKMIDLIDVSLDEIA